MTDATDAAAAPAAALIQTPGALFAAMQADHDAALRKLDALKIQLAQSLDKAKGDIGHLGYHDAYIRDVGLKIDEIAAWIKRAL